MPFTPFHFGFHAALAFWFRRWLDLPVFILTNIVIDIEPLLVMVFGLDYPLHGHCHTFLIGGMVGALYAVLAYFLRRWTGKGMALLGLDYTTTFVKIFFSAILGVFFHVLFDAILYRDIRPFWPWDKNPLLELLPLPAVYGICLLFFIPAVIYYVRQRKIHA